MEEELTPGTIAVLDRFKTQLRQALPKCSDQIDQAPYLEAVMWLIAGFDMNQFVRNNLHKMMGKGEISTFDMHQYTQEAFETEKQRNGKAMDFEDELNYFKKIHAPAIKGIQTFDINDLINYVLVKGFNFDFLIEANNEEINKGGHGKN